MVDNKFLTEIIELGSWCSELHQKLTYHLIYGTNRFSFRIIEPIWCRYLLKISSMGRKTRRTKTTKSTTMDFKSKARFLRHSQ
jgi:hypothetical protein